MGNQPSQPKITAQDKAIYQLKRQRDTLQQYQQRLAGVMARQTELAKAAVQAGDTARAKFYLKAKRRQQTVVASAYEQLATLEQLIGTIEFKLIEKDVVQGLAKGNEVLKALNADMSVGKIDQLMDDLEDERLRVDEVLEQLAGGLSAVDDAEVDEELARMEAEVSPVKMPSVPDTAVEVLELPEVPDTEIGEEERERIAA